MFDDSVLHGNGCHFIQRSDALPAIAVGWVARHSSDDRLVDQNTLLSHLGLVAGGEWLAWLISVDAILVLSGATLTSYVGVTGLVERMTLDRCLPRFLLKKGRRKTPHRIIVLFFLLSVSVLLIT